MAGRSSTTRGSLTPKPIKAVAITHWHNDHPQGVSAIRDAFPNVRIIATSATEAGMLGPEAAAGRLPARSRSWKRSSTKQVDAVQRAACSKLLDDPATTARPARADQEGAGGLRRNSWRDYRGTYIVPPTETFERELVLDDPNVPVRLMHLGRANTDGDLIAWLPQQKIVATGDIVVAPTAVRLLQLSRRLDRDHRQAQGAWRSRP